MTDLKTACATTEGVFRVVAQHLRTQGIRAAIPGTKFNCRYRVAADVGSTNPLKCAVGCLIADDHYNPKIEGASLVAPKVRAAVEQSIGRTLTENEVEMLLALQRLHDYTPPDQWEAHLLREEWRTYFDRGETC